MLWKPANVQLRNVKSKNVGSFFPASQILASEGLRQARTIKNNMESVSNVIHIQTFNLEWGSKTEPLRGVAAESVPKCEDGRGCKAFGVFYTTFDTAKRPVSTSHLRAQEPGSRLKTILDNKKTFFWLSLTAVKPQEPDSWNPGVVGRPKKHVGANQQLKTTDHILYNSMT